MRETLDLIDALMITYASQLVAEYRRNFIPYIIDTMRRHVHYFREEADDDEATACNDAG